MSSIHIFNSTHLFFFSFKICNTFPILFDYFPGSHNTVIKNFTEITDYILEKIKEHQQTLDADNPRDFIDCFIIKMKQVKCYLFACAVGSLMICDYWGQIRIALRSPRLWLSVANLLILFKKYRYPMLSRHHKTLKIAGGLCYVAENVVMLDMCSSSFCLHSGSENGCFRLQPSVHFARERIYDKNLD